MADIYVKSGSGVAARANSTTYAAGDRVVPARADTAGNAALAKKFVWEVTAGGGGSSGSAVPTWPGSVTADSTTVTDGALTLTARNPGYSSGTTVDWTFATIFLDYAGSATAAGDRVLISDNHAESVGAAVTLAFAGTAASPTQVICVDDAASPMTVATTATVTTTGTNVTITVTGSSYFYGITFSAGTGANSSSLTLRQTGHINVYEQCAFILATSSSSSVISIGADESVFMARNCNFKFGATGQVISIGGGSVEWNGGALLSGGSTPTTLVNANPSSVRGGTSIFSGLDLSNASASINLLSAAQNGTYSVTFRDCRMPSSWSGVLLNGTREPQTKASMCNIYAGTSTYAMRYDDYAGSVRDETTLIRSGGANDGTAGLSWKLTTTSQNPTYSMPLASPEVVRWNDATGSAVTVTVETLTDNVTLKDIECWLEVMYLGTSGQPLGKFTTSAADVVASGSNLTTSSETWTTTGLGTPVKQKLNVSFTPQEKGYIHARVVLAKASTTVYVCPKLAVA